MANSIKEYIAGTNPDGTTYTVSAVYNYTTPDYLTGRGATDIKVYVGDVIQPTTAYVLSGTSLNFMNTALPTAGHTIRIERVTGSTSRDVNYTDGALLDAHTLDLDSNQIFYLAQEAGDKADVASIEAGKTLVGASTFYKSQVVAPTDPITGDLWYDLSEAPYQLKIWDGAFWRTNAPLITKFKYYVTQADIDSAAAGTGIFIAPFTMFVEGQTEAYLNGIRLSEGGYAELNTLENNPTESPSLTPDFLRLAELTAETIDWFYSETYEGYLFRGDLNASDIIEIHLASDSQYYSEIKISEANVVQLEASVQQAGTDAITKYDQVLSISDAFLANQYQAVAVAASNAAGASEAAAAASELAAQGYAQTAQVLSGQAQSVIAGWVTLDQQTIHTQGSTDPTLYSNTGLDIKTSDSVKINDIPLPLYKGMLTLGGTPNLFYKKPNASYSLYGEKISGGIYAIWLNQHKDNNGVDLLGTGNMLTATPDIDPQNTVYTNDDDYNVMCFYQGNAFCRYRIEKTADYFVITLQDELGNILDSGDLLLTIEEKL